MSAKQLVSPATKLYDEDFALWTAEAARLLREGRFAEIDVEHVAQEIEDMGKRDYREVLSRLVLILQHLLKWQFQPDKRTGSWKTTLINQRREIELVFEQSPSLRRAAVQLVPRAYRQAIQDAAGETGLSEDTFPGECPYTLEQALDRHVFAGSG
jgi:hypothetical protein